MRKARIAGRIGRQQSLVARRIVTFSQEGDTVGVGQRFGLIRFGSRVDVYLPAGSDWYAFQNNQAPLLGAVQGGTVVSYTADLGYEIFTDHMSVRHLWDVLTEAGAKRIFFDLVFHGPTTPAERHQGKLAGNQAPVPQDIYGPWPDKPAYAKRRACQK